MKTTNFCFIDASGHQLSISAARLFPALFLTFSISYFDLTQNYCSCPMKYCRCKWVCFSVYCNQYYVKLNRMKARGISMDPNNLHSLQIIHFTPFCNPSHILHFLQQLLYISGLLFYSHPTNPDIL